MYDIIIIGAGPAGLTSAIYARRNNKKVLILEAKSYGGQIINTLNIENYPGIDKISGFDFATRLYKQVQKLGAEIKYEKAIEIKNYDDRKEVLTLNNIYETKTVIIATGSKNKSLGIDGEKDLVGRGISYCATCDGALYRRKDVAIVGGGNVALDDAIYMSNIANKVYLIHRKSKFKAEDTLIEKVKSIDNIEIITNSNLVSINGKDKLESIVLINKYDQKRIIEVSGLFVAIGRTPENDIFRKIINLDKSGYIIADEDCKTDVEGIFVAGDTRTKELRQIVTATSDGAIAASEAIKYINKK